MKLLLDENLSRKLLISLGERYPGSAHVDDVGLRGRSDIDVWEYASLHGFAVVSKDDDFRQLSFLRGAPPKVVRLVVGNAGTGAIAALLVHHAQTLREFDADEDASLLVLRMSADSHAAGDVSLNDATKADVPPPVRWHVLSTRDALEAEARSRIDRAARQAFARSDRFRIVLAGGETPRNIYRSLVRLETDWGRWEVYFGDERCLPPGDVGRNDRMAFDAWLDHVPISRDAIYRIPAEQGAAAAARAYGRILASVGRFDLVLLGLGEDGHTASLFPGSDPGEAADSPDVLAVFDAPKPPPERVTMSARRLSRASRVLFLVAGESKCDAVRRWKNGEDIPAASIRCAVGVDVLAEDAAGDG